MAKHLIFTKEDMDLEMLIRYCKQEGIIEEG